MEISFDEKIGQSIPLALCVSCKFCLKDSNNECYNCENQRVLGKKYCEECLNKTLDSQRQDCSTLYTNFSVFDLNSDITSTNMTLCDEQKVDRIKCGRKSFYKPRYMLDKSDGQVKYTVYISYLSCGVLSSDIMYNFSVDFPTSDGNFERSKIQSVSFSFNNRESKRYSLNELEGLFTEQNPMIKGGLVYYEIKLNLYCSSEINMDNVDISVVTEVLLNVNLRTNLLLWYIYNDMRVGDFEVVELYSLKEKHEFLKQQRESTTSNLLFLPSRPQERVIKRFN